jgi:tryptophan 2,3-dioxygenase
MSSKHRLGGGDAGDITYEGYLKVPELIGLQKCLSEPQNHDELLFIIVHQAYELWFRQILFELDATVGALESGDVGNAAHWMRRVGAIERLLVPQIHILETMTPVDFLGFRERLNPASGFQSVQFREVEFISGLKDKRILDEFAGDTHAAARLRRRFDAPGLNEGFRSILRGGGFEQPEGDDPVAVEARLSGLQRLYERPDEARDLYNLAEFLLDHDENIQLWRYHHVRMVERMIGFKVGTGGSEGVGYLTSTLKKRFFPDLWAVRTRIGKRTQEKS